MKACLLNEPQDLDRCFLYASWVSLPVLKKDGSSGAQSRWEDGKAALSSLSTLSSFASPWLSKRLALVLSSCKFNQHNLFLWFQNIFFFFLDAIPGLSFPGVLLCAIKLPSLVTLYLFWSFTWLSTLSSDPFSFLSISPAHRTLGKQNVISRVALKVKPDVLMS